MGFSEILASLQANPYFGAGAGLVGIGLGATVLRKSFQFGSVAFRRHCMTTLEVTNQDACYPWLMKWVTERGARTTQHLSVQTAFSRSEAGRVATQFEFIPSLGDHFFNHKGTWIKVARFRENRAMSSKTGSPFESVTLTAISRKRSLFSGILHDARQMALDAIEGRTIIYVPKSSSWEPFGYPQRKRPLDSVILEEGVSEAICADVREFVESAQWYYDRGIPHRRGYLLHGPPGCGKSSFITALAGELDYSICVMNLSEMGVTDDRLGYMLSVTPPETLILLEDIDAAAINRDLSKEDPVKYKGMGRLTLSGLLNALDGVTSSDARIVFMTTNYMDRLDPALIRPGRVDYKQLIGYCSGIQLKKMYTRFYPHLPQELAEEFAQRFSANYPNPSPAQVQGHFMMNKHDGRKAIEDIR